MTLPADSNSAGMEGQGGDAANLVALGPHGVILDPEIYRDERWCANCAGPRVFLEIYETDFGRLVCCQGCGDERVVAFSRVTSEVA